MLNMVFFIEQAKAQVEYDRHMSQLSAKLKTKTFRLASKDSCSGMDILFKNAKQLCNNNPKFNDSVIVALFRAVIAKNKHRHNVAIEEKVVNFYRFINTHNPKLSQVVSGNLHGPSDRWIRKLNGLDKNECIIDSGNDLYMIVSREEAAISIRKNIFGKQVPFSLEIDAIKVPQLHEVSHRYKSIIGGEYLNHMIEIEGKTKGQIVLLLDGISRKDLDNNVLGKINNTIEVIVCVMSFQLSLPGMLHTELVAVHPTSF